jgi:predicted DNA-binding transcriptional regulator AlpA
MRLEQERCLTRDDLSRMLGVSTRTVRRIEREGNGPKQIRLGYRTVRYHPDEVAQFMSGIGVSTPAELRLGFGLPSAL